MMQRINVSRIENILIQINVTIFLICSVVNGGTIKKASALYEV